MVAAALALIVTGVYVGVAARRGPRFPSAWDPRVATIAAFVEKETALVFEHPVSVRFLDDTDFNALVTTDPGSIDDATRQQFRDQAASGRSLGLFTGDVDLAAQDTTLRSAGILAFYDNGRKEIVVRGDVAPTDELSVDVRVTLAHEMTHTLQDQYWDLSPYRSRASDDSGRSARLALVEGHATFVENAYIDDLSPAERRAYDDANDRALADIGDATQDVTPILSALLGAPYAIGPGFVAALQEKGGGALATAFTDEPPVAEDQLLLPSHYFAGDKPEDVAAPTLPDRAEELERTQLGPIGLFFVLAGELPATEALAVADGWGNDAELTYRGSGSVCTMLRITGDDDASTTAIADALTRWAAGRPPEMGASVNTGDGTVDMTSCDPGPNIQQHVAERAATQQLFGRSSDLADLIPRYGLAAAECIAQRVYERYTVAELESGSGQDELAAAFSACGEG